MLVKVPMDTLEAIEQGTWKHWEVMRELDIGVHDHHGIIH